MTRITDFGRKRTYLEAGLASQAEPLPEASTGHSEITDPPGASAAAVDTVNDEATAPSKKKRKRTKKAKKDGQDTVAGTVPAEGVAKEGDTIAGEGDGPTHAGEDLVANATKEGDSGKTGKVKKQKQPKKKSAAVSSSESRRQRRIAEKNSDTTCFACREKGHAARDCPKSQNAEGNNSKLKSTVGICYRCGSRQHTLSRCKKPVDNMNPLPFASCFVCSTKGHLASACPSNKAKGVYPNGGCCKLCGDTSHLAKDCNLRKKETVDDSVVMGVGRNIGADEDDFHSFKRRKTEVDQGEKEEEKVKRLIDIKAGVHSGVLKSFGKSVAPPKKVVYF